MAAARRRRSWRSTSVRALPGLGLEGDRYAAPPGGTFGHKRSVER